MTPDFNTILANEEIRTYITQADASLIALGYTEHSFAHVTKCAHTAAAILEKLVSSGISLTPAVSMLLRIVSSV